MSHPANSRLSILVAAALVAGTLSASTLLAETPARASAAEKAPTTRTGTTANPYAQQYSHMITQLQLTDAQKGQLKPLVDAMVSQMDDSRLAVTMKLRDQNTAAYTKSGDDRTKALQQLHDEAEKAYADYNKLISDGQAKINAVLTPEQRLAWEVFKIHNALSNRLMLANLTEEQGAKLKTIIETSAKELAATPDVLVLNSPVAGKLVRKIITDILTDEQVAAFTVGTILPFAIPGNPGKVPMPPRSPAAAKAPAKEKDPTLP